MWRRLVLCRVSLDFTGRPGSRQEALWEPKSGREDRRSSLTQCVSFLSSRCPDGSWPARCVPSRHRPGPRPPPPPLRRRPAALPSSWCSAHTAPSPRPSARPTPCQRQRWQSQWRQRRGSPRSPECGDTTSVAGGPLRPAGGPACRGASCTPSGPHLSGRHQGKIIRVSIQKKSISLGENALWFCFCNLKVKINHWLYKNGVELQVFEKKTTVEVCDQQSLHSIGCN